MVTWFRRSYHTIAWFKLPFRSCVNTEITKILKKRFMCTFLIYLMTYPCKPRCTFFCYYFPFNVVLCVTNKGGKISKFRWENDPKFVKNIYKISAADVSCCAEDNTVECCSHKAATTLADLGRGSSETVSKEPNDAHLKPEEKGSSPKEPAKIIKGWDIPPGAGHVI